MAEKKAGKGTGAAKAPRGRKGGGVDPQTPLWAAIPLALLSGCLVFLSFPPWDLFPLQWLAWVPLLVALRGRTFWPAFALGFVSGWTTNVGGFHWMSDLLREFGHMGPVPSNGIMLLMNAWQGLTVALASGLAATVTGRLRLPWVVAFPVIYTAVEWLVPFLFPWYWANGQQRFTWVTQIVDVTGVSGLTFVMVFVNATLAAIVRARLEKRTFPWAAAVAAVAMAGGTLTYGAIRTAEVDAEVAAGPKFRIGMVEADVGIWEKEARNPDGSRLSPEDQVRMIHGNLLKHQELSARLERESKPDLIVWPESSYFPLRDVLTRRTGRVALLAGTDGRLWVVEDGEVRPAPGSGADTVARGTGLRAAAAETEDRMIAVGQRGSAFVLRAGTWTREATGSDRDLLAVAIAPNGDALAVGAQGTAAVRRTEGWRPVELGTTADLRGVTWTRDLGFVVCGDGGTLLSLKDRKVYPLAPGNAVDLLACSWDDGVGLVAVGTGGTVLRIDRAGTVALEQPVKGTLRGVAAGSTTWAAGDDGALVRCRAGACQAVPSGVQADLRAVAGDGTGSGQAWAVGTGGTVLALPGGDGKPARLAGASGDLAGAGWVPFGEGYPLPRDVKSVYVSRAPLPPIDVADPYAAVALDVDTPDRDRNAAMRGFSTPLLFGVVAEERVAPGESRYFNSATLVDSAGQVRGFYDKVYLLLFGERLPFVDWFPFLKKWLPEAGDFTPGDEVKAFALGAARLGLLICYEDILPTFTRDVAKLDPNLLMNITNDAWFGKTAEPWLHLQLATFRAIEHRRFLLRSTNTGVSVVVDPLGRILQHTELDRAETLVHDVTLMEGETIYRRYGDLFAWAAVALAGLMLAGAMARRRL